MGIYKRIRRNSPHLLQSGGPNDSSSTSQPHVMTGLGDDSFQLPMWRKGDLIEYFGERHGSQWLAGCVTDVRRDMLRLKVQVLDRGTFIKWLPEGSTCIRRQLPDMELRSHHLIKPKSHTPCLCTIPEYARLQIEDREAEEDEPDSPIVQRQGGKSLVEKFCRRCKPWGGA